MEIQCKKIECQYEWNYHGKRTGTFYVSCPKCHTGTKVTKTMEEQGGETSAPSPQLPALEDLRR